MGCHIQNKKGVSAAYSQESPEEVSGNPATNFRSSHKVFPGLLQSAGSTNEFPEIHAASFREMFVKPSTTKTPGETRKEGNSNVPERVSRVSTSVSGICETNFQSSD